MSNIFLYITISLLIVYIVYMHIKYNIYVIKMRRNKQPHKYYACETYIKSFRVGDMTVSYYYFVKLLYCGYISPNEVLPTNNDNHVIIISGYDYKIMLARGYYLAYGYG